MKFFGKLDDERLATLVARGDESAFAALYDRHHAPLLAFCRHMVGNREDGEDALQQTFLRAHRALLAGRVPDTVRPWLFAIARNRCRTLLAARRDAAVPVDELEPALDGLADEVVRRADLRELVADLAGLPEDQRGALVLFEMGDLSHREIAGVIGCPPEKVKALVFQARSALIAEREARETPCEDIRGQLAVGRAGALRRAPLRRHLRHCEPCTEFRLAVAGQRTRLALILPVAPSVGLKAAVLGGSGGGAAVAAGAAVAGGGAAGLAAKAAIVAAVAGTGVTGGVATVDAVTQREPAKTAPAPVVRPAAAPVRLVAADPTPEPVEPRVVGRHERRRRAAPPPEETTAPAAELPPVRTGERALAGRRRARRIQRVARRHSVSPRRVRRHLRRRAAVRRRQAPPRGGRAAGGRHRRRAPPAPAPAAATGAHAGADTRAHPDARAHPGADSGAHPRADARADPHADALNHGVHIRRFNRGSVAITGRESALMRFGESMAGRRTGWRPTGRERRG